MVSPCLTFHVSGHKSGASLPSYTGHIKCKTDCGSGLSTGADLQLGHDVLTANEVQTCEMKNNGSNVLSEVPVWSKRMLSESAAVLHLCCFCMN